MAKTLTFEIPENEYYLLKSFMEECSAEIKKSLEIMKKDKAEIDTLDKEIKSIKEETAHSKQKSDEILNKLLKEHSIFIRNV